MTTIGSYTPPKIEPKDEPPPPTPSGEPTQPDPAAAASGGATSGLLPTPGSSVPGGIGAFDNGGANKPEQAGIGVGGA